MKQSQKTMAFWIVLILVSFILLNNMNKPSKDKDMQFSEFVRHVEEKKVAKVTLKNDDIIIGKFTQDIENGATFKVIGRTGDSTFKLLKDNGLTPDYAPKEEPSFLSVFLMNWGPMLFLMIIIYFFIRQMQSGGGKAMSFGKSRARMLNPSDKKVTFKDVSGVEEAKEELKEVVDFLKDPKKYTALGGKIPKGVILVGPPGTGKTLLAKSVAGEANVPFFSISGSDFVEMFVGVGASRVRDLFEQGKKHAPCIIFIDEIDAVGRHRGAGLGGGHDEREQTLNQLLVEMDGFESNEGVILIAATNRIDVLDPALLRPGRFDRRVTVDRPDVRGRHGILKVHTKKTPLSKSVDLEVIAKGTPGFTGADLANLVNEAALLAARVNKKLIEMLDFEDAKDKVLMGVARRSMVISDKEKRNTAYHEAGHTLVGIHLPHTDPIHKVTIIPRGGALGITQTLPNEDMLSLTKEKAKNLIAFLMGGRVAEELTFGDYTNGASNDIERATDLATKMVTEWGMSTTMGPIKFGSTREQPFAGMGQESSGISQSTSQKIDAEVSRIVKENYELAKKILTDNKDTLERLSEALIVWETLDSQQINDIVAGKEIGVPHLDQDESGGSSSGSDDKKKEEVSKKPKGFDPSGQGSAAPA